MSNQGEEKQEKGHELSCLKSLTTTSLGALEGHWIVTVEQLVGAAATEAGRKGLEALLGEGTEPVDLLLREARELLGDERCDELMQARPGGPLGAWFDAPQAEIGADQ